MSRKKIIILLLVIAAIHAVIIFGLLPAKKSGGGKAAAKPALAAAENAPLPAAVPPSPPEIQTPPPPPEVVSAAPAVRKITPWDYRFPQKLPAGLQKRARRARSGMIVDLSNRRVLWSKEPRRPVAVASLTKLMTALLVAEKMQRDPGFKWDSPVKITAAATAVERSCVLGLQQNEVYTLEELMQSMMINSHNDSAAQIAEKISGSVPAFVALMNRRGNELGLASVKFNSPNGLPQGKKRINSFASASDIAHICELLMAYPHIMELCVMRSAQMHTGKKVYSHNNLLLGPTKKRPQRRQVPGIIGFKTGFTNAAGCCLAFGVKRNGKTVIGCVTGFPSAVERDTFCREIIEWAYRKK